MQSQSITGYDVADFGDKFMFLASVTKLAKEQTPDNLHPSTLIELPAEHKVLVAEMGDTILPLPADEMFIARQSIAPMARNALETGQFDHDAPSGTDLLKDWFDLNNVIARVKYVKTKSSS